MFRMRNVRPGVVLLVVVVVAACAQKKAPGPATGTQVAKLSVSGMTCDSCAKSITASLKSAEGVAEADVSFATKSAVVTYDPQRMKPSDIVRTIESAGYTAQLLEPPAADATTSALQSEAGFEGCKMACGTKRAYREQDVVAQPDAKVGDLARCPVSGAVFDVKEDSPFFLHDGKKIFACCSSCAAQFQIDSSRYLTRLTAQNRAHASATAATAQSDQRVARDYEADKTSFFKVPLGCGPYEGFGCGSLARPLLGKIEKELSGSVTWLNHRGNLLAVVWQTTEARFAGEKKVGDLAKQSEISATLLTADARSDAAKEFASAEPWYRQNELEKLSRLEAETFSTRFTDRIAARIIIGSAAREALRLDLARVLLEHFLKTDGRPTLLLKSQLKAAAAKHLDAAGMTAFDSAIKNGSKRQPGDSV